MKPGGCSRVLQGRFSLSCADGNGSPANSSLLGLNVGRGGHVKLRLRRPRGNFDFFSYEEVLDTMLHELCHIEHGPHDALFYKLWDDIRKECEELMAKGIAGTGLGFDAPGRRLGGYSLQPSLSSLRETSLAAAERRKITASLLPPGPKRLGGDGNIMASLTPVQAAAMAAERRILDDRWCASESQERSWISIASDDDVEEHGSKRSAVMLNTSVTEERLGKRIRSADLGGCSAGHDLQPSISGTTFSCGHVYNSEDQTAWECPVCTLINKPLSLACEACGSERPKVTGDGSKAWSCKFCTLDNSVKAERCSACGEWRYSRGAPASTRGPNLGT